MRGSLLRSATVRLLVPLLATTVVVFSIYAVVTYRSITAEWTESVYSWARRFGDLTKRATHHSMLENRKDDVQYIVQLIGDSPGVVGLHVYDKHGAVAFSSKPAEIGNKVDLGAEACVVCHDRSRPLSSVSTDKRTRVYRNAAGQRIFGVIVPIENQPQCASSGCHAPVREQSILAVLDVQMSLEPLDGALQTARWRWLWLTIAVALVVSAGTVAFVYRIVRRPVMKLYAGTRRIAAGDLDTRIEVTSRDELGQLASAFNTMTADLRTAREEAMNWSQRLEQKVVEKTDELGRAQRQVMLMDKMASLGKLAATVAHELNNPLGGILNYAKLVERELRDGPGEAPLDPATRDELMRYLQVIQQESRRSGDIVRNLLLFARQSGARLAPVHLDEVVERALVIMRHRLEMAQVALERESIPAGEDVLVCDADQIQQALVALVVNAVEAMEEGGGGTLRVRTAATPDMVELSVSDTGAGIPPEIIGQIFEPFFSTKGKESGVGLGLAVVYGIVRGHGGTIDVKSNPGHGTTFTIKLPRQVAEERPYGEHA